MPKTTKTSSKSDKVSSYRNATSDAPLKLTDSNHQKAFDLIILKSSHPAVKRLKKDHEPEIHGNKFWGSSFLLMDYFSKHPIELEQSVLEAGVGWGLAGIYLNKTYAAKVTGVDADDQVFPYLELHADINACEISVQKKRFEKLTKKQLAEFDMLIAADICFWDELTEIVYKMIKRAIQAGVKKIVIADPGRQPFFDMAEKCEEIFFGEMTQVSLKKPKARGYLLVIENA
jgi:predicted nicotinamide N-methyase